MAIDFMVMPLSRYVAGDFVTPAMRLAWESGVEYRIHGPDGARVFPTGVPFGGPDAAARRRQFVPMVLDDLRGVLGDRVWDEGSDAEPRFHRVDPASFAALHAWAAQALSRSKPSWLDRLRGKGRDPGERRMAHLLGTVFVPLDIETPVSVSSPMEGILVSIGIALEQLGRDMPAPTHDARDTLRAALEDAATLGLPMIVDA